MGAAALVVGAAVSIAGTVSSIQSQNRQVEAQNQAIASQISANRQSEKIRQMQNEAQAAIIDQEYNNAKIARRTQYQQERQQISQFATQARNAEANTQRDLANTNRQLTNQELAAIGQIDQTLAQTNQGVTESDINTLQQLSEALSRVENVNPSVTNLKQEIDNTIASTIAVSGGRGRTSDVVASSGQRDIVNEALQAIQTSGSISAEAAQELANSQEFSNIVKGIANSSAALQQSSLGEQLAAARRQNEISGKVATQQRNSLLQQLRGAQGLNRIDKRLQDQQAKINRGIAQGSLITGIGLQRAQSAQQIAALSAQQASPISGLQAFASIGSSIAPLIGQLATPQPSTQLQPQFLSKPPATPQYLSKGPGVPL